MYHFLIDTVDTRECTAKLVAIKGGRAALEYTSPNSNLKNTQALLPGSIYTIDTSAMATTLQPRTDYLISGSWLNFTKTIPPQFVLCATSAKMITIEQLLNA